jgi:hypothetical protein
MLIGRAAVVHSLLAAAALTLLEPKRPAVALENQGPLGATCAGFGCNDYRGQSFDGIPAADAPPAVVPITNRPIPSAAPSSMPYSDFLQAVKDKRVFGVDLMAPNGDEAYALIKDAAGTGKRCSEYDPNARVVDGACRLRMGAGWPVEVSNSWSSPTWVMRILDNEKIPYRFNIDLKMKRVRKTYPTAAGGK